MTLLTGHGLGSTVDQGTSGAIKRAKSGSNLSKRFKAVELRSKLAELKKLVAKGDKTDAEMMDELNKESAPIKGMSDDDEEAGPAIRLAAPSSTRLKITPAIYNELKRELFRQGVADLNSKSAEETYLEYSWAQQACINDLDAIIRDAGEQVNAKLGAIRAKSDIRDKMLKTGQDMGIIAREPERKLVLHGHVVSQMNDVELRKLIANEMSGFTQVMKRFGNVDMDGNPIDADGEEAGQATLPAPKFSDDAKPRQALGGLGKAQAARKSRVAVKRTKVIDVTANGG